MYIKDGSSFSYCANKEIKNFYSWGWLGDKIAESDKWNLDDEKEVELKSTIIAILKNLSNSAINFCMGDHLCEICEPLHEAINEFNGSIELECNGKIFSCPNGVEHYIEAHNYKPPEEAIQAIFKGFPVPDERMHK